MNRISKVLLSIYLLSSSYCIQSHPYWPENRNITDWIDRERKLNWVLAQNNIQRKAPSYQREMKATYRVGQTISIITPYDGRGDFCRWQFLFNGRLAGYDEGVSKLEQSGLMQFAGFTIDERMCIEICSSHFPCESVDQMTMNFVATKPGKIIFYMKNREYQNYHNHGCDCKPTVTKFEIDIVDNYNATYYIQ